VPPLLGAVPLLVPRDIRCSHEVIAFDTVFAAVGQYGPVQGGTFGIAHPGVTVLRSSQHNGPPLARQNQEAFGVRSKNVMRFFVLDNYLPRDSFQVPTRLSASTANSGTEIARSVKSKARIFLPFYLELFTASMSGLCRSGIANLRANKADNSDYLLLHKRTVAMEGWT
jgi:hypothetical protein